MRKWLVLASFLVLAATFVPALIASCGGGSKTFPADGPRVDAYRDTGLHSAVCAAVQTFVQDNANHSTPATAQHFTVNITVPQTKFALLGPRNPVDASTQYMQLSGYIDVDGFTANQAVDVELFDGPMCAATGCSTTVTITCGPSTTGSGTVDLFGNGGSGACGSGSTTADSSGTLHIFIDPASTGGEDNGVEITTR